jgi:hypothetical protein
MCRIRLSEGISKYQQLKNKSDATALNIVLKVLEKILLKRLLPVVQNNRLIPNHQFGFRQRQSTIE